MGGIGGREAIKAGYKRIIGAYCNQEYFHYGNNFRFKVDLFKKAVLDNLKSSIENIDFSAKTVWKG